MQADLIFDVGMSNGDDTAYYLSRGFRVVAMEANPTLCAAARERFAEAVAANRLTVVNCAVAEEDGDLPFWICETHPEWSSFDRGIVSRDGAPHHSISVNGRRFASVLEEYGVPFYLKVDIEGSDWLCVEALRGQQLPRYLSIEQSARVLERLDTLHDLGFESFKCISQHHFLPLQNPISDEEREYARYWRRLTSRKLGWRVVRRLGLDRMAARKAGELRRVAGWQFPRGSSGPFGEETRGRWLSYSEFKSIVLDSNAAFAVRKPSIFWGSEPYSFWADFHMRSGSPS